MLNLKEMKQEFINNIIEGIIGLPRSLAEPFEAIINDIKNGEYSSWEQLLHDEEEVYALIREAWAAAIVRKMNTIMAKV